MADSTLVGRQDELTRLAGHLPAGQRPGGPTLVVVVGEAGIGKTRLVDELAADAAASCLVVRGRADEHEAVAFGLWLGPLRQLHLPRPGTDASIPSTELRWDVVDLLASGMRSSAPMLVVLDDLHWADDGSLWILEHVLDRLAGAAVTVVATSRPGAEARAVRWHGIYRRAEVVALDGLDVGEIGELTQRLGSSRDQADELWRRTGGNPLLVRELVLAGPAGAASTGDLLTATIERAGPQVAALVSVLAIAGPGAPLPVLADAMSRSTDDLEDLVDAARAADLVREEDGRLRVRHDLLAEAAAHRLSPVERRRLHAELARAWASRTEPAARAAAARHRLLALPPAEPPARGPSAADADADADADAAGEEVIETGRALVLDGHAADAAALLDLADTTLMDRTDLRAGLKARLALADVDARWAMDDLEGAMSIAEGAVGLATAAGDPVLVASAEVAAVAHHNPMVADRSRVERLAAADAALPAAHDEVDPALRIRLRGRRAVVMMSFPDLRHEAEALGEDAVTRAREVGDPDLFLQAISDRLFVLATPDDFDARAIAAEEILELSRTTGRMTFARRGLEWQYTSRFATGDLDGALASLAELEALAAIMPSPYWRWVAALRRCGMLAMLGDREGALSLVVAARELAAGVAPEGEAEGLEGGLRLLIASLYGRTDGGADKLYVDNIAHANESPVLFLQARFALTEALLGEAAAARRRLSHLRGRFGDAMREIEGLPTMGVLARTVHLLGWEEAAAELRAILRPFSGRLVSGNGIVLDLPVDHHLAALALLQGDHDDADHRARAAVALARRLRLPTIEARTLELAGDVAERRGDLAAAASARDAAATLAEPIGLLLHRGGHPPVAPLAPVAPVAPVAAPASVREVSLHLDGGRWFIDSPFGSGHVASSTGMGQLVRLLVAPGIELAAVDLAGAGQGGEIVVNRDLGPLLDARAKREYRRRIADLQAEIDEADGNHDPARADRSRVELDLLIGELRSAVGLGGRDRPQGSGNERARINVARNIRRAIAAIAASVPDLGAHLDVSIRTGHRCAYTPEPAARLEWRVH